MSGYLSADKMGVGGEPVQKITVAEWSGRGLDI